MYTLITRASFDRKKHTKCFEIKPLWIMSWIMSGKLALLENKRCTGKYACNGLLCSIRKGSCVFCHHLGMLDLVFHGFSGYHELGVRITGWSCICSLFHFYFFGLLTSLWPWFPLGPRGQFTLPLRDCILTCRPHATGIPVGVTFCSIVRHVS